MIIVSRITVLASGLVLCFLLTSSAWANSGDLDPSFGTNGVVRLSDYTSVINPFLAVQPDGHILVAFTTISGYPFKWWLIRLKPDGTLDENFGDGGHTRIESPSDYSDLQIKGFGLQADGKIVVGGGKSSETILARYNSDGTLDSGFGEDGFLILGYGSGIDWLATIGIQTDGKIVVAGADNGDFAIVRLDEEGHFDPDFNGSGRVVTDLGVGEYDIITSIVLKNEKIIAAGYSSDGDDSTPYTGAIAIYNGDGTLDMAFDGDGILFHDYTPFGTSFAVQSDGKILMATNISPDTNIFIHFGLLSRINTDGTVDSSFGTNGEVTDEDRTFMLLSLQPDGKILVASIDSSYSDSAIMRFNQDGTVDDTFGVGGKSESLPKPDPYSVNLIRAMAVQADGKIIGAGTNSSPVAMLYLARYLGDSDGTADGTDSESTADSGATSGGCALVR